MTECCRLDGWTAARQPEATADSSKLLIEDQLAEIPVGSSEFKELDKAVNQFCPFEAVGMARQEIRHAHFLAYILDPNCPHGFGDAVLRAVLETLLQEFSDVSSLDLHLVDLSRATIRREWESIDL